MTLKVIESSKELTEEQKEVAAGLQMLRQRVLAGEVTAVSVIFLESNGSIGDDLFGSIPPGDLHLACHEMMIELATPDD